MNGHLEGVPQPYLGDENPTNWDDPPSSWCLGGSDLDLPFRFNQHILAHSWKAATIFCIGGGSWRTRNDEGVRRAGCVLCWGHVG